MGVRGLIEGWPVYRQLTGAEPLGHRLEAALNDWRSQHPFPEVFHGRASALARSG